MENNEYEEIQGQFVEQDEQLEKEIARSNKLRKIVFECKSKIFKDDKMITIVGTCILFLLLPFAVWFLIEYVFPQENIKSQEFLFWFGIVLLGLVGLMDLISTMVVYRKLNLKEALDDDVPAVKARFDDFKKRYKTLSLIEFVLWFLIVAIVCAWFCTSLETKDGNVLAIIILSCALGGVLGILFGVWYLRSIMNACDELVELLEI